MSCGDHIDRGANRYFLPKHPVFTANMLAVNRLMQFIPTASLVNRLNLTGVQQLADYSIVSRGFVMQANSFLTNIIL
jgi:hypothetical protein